VEATDRRLRVDSAISQAKYRRTPESIVAAQSGKRIAETGHWVGIWRKSDGTMHKTGIYLAMWIPSGGTWRLKSESFVTLSCTVAPIAKSRADIIWTHIGTLLRSAGMEFNNLVSLRTYLADPEYDEANVRMRVKYLGDHETSSTVVCCRLLDPKWKLEIEAMAAG
jgi:hypothetical protein